MQTIPERIADLTQAIERHKRLLVLLASWAKTHEAVMERSVGALRTVRTATEQLEREVAQAEEALAKLEAQCPKCNGTGRVPIAIGESANCPVCHPLEPVA